jgi:hypothetical protein
MWLYLRSIWSTDARIPETLEVDLRNAIRAAGGSQVWVGAEEDGRIDVLVALEAATANGTMVIGEQVVRDLYGGRRFEYGVTGFAGWLLDADRPTNGADSS